MIPYPAYKTTNLPWLPKIPEHWEAIKIRELFVERNQKVSDKDFAPLSVSKGGIVPQIATVAKTDNGENRKLVREGDFVINSRSDRKGSSGISAFDGSVSLINLVLRPRVACNRRYLHYLLKSIPFVEEYYRNGRGIVADLWTTRYSEMKTISIPFPSSAEQEQIMRYLDSMTAKINKLVRAKKKQIALLQEQRQAIINQAVTKGLDPNVEMKDSGQSRIGTIPRHWLLKEVKRMCRLQGGSGFPVEYQGNFSESIPFIKVNSLSSHISTLRQYDTVSPETAKLLNAKVFSQGDIVFAKVGAALLLHRFEILPFDCCIDNNMMAMYNISENVYWLKYALSLLNFNDLVNPGAVPSISQTQVGSLLIPCPPNSEQMEIVSHIERHSRKIDTLISRIEHSIICLQEYKNSLISSVVTGQTDVRNISVEDAIPDDLIPDDDPPSEIEEDPSTESEE